MTTESEKDEANLEGIFRHLLRLQKGRESRGRGKRRNGSRDSKGPVKNSLSEMLDHQVKMIARRLKDDSNE